MDDSSRESIQKQSIQDKTYHTISTTKPSHSQFLSVEICCVMYAIELQ